MPVWPFRRGRNAAEPDLPPAPRSILDEIDESTPHRYRIWLADAADRDRVLPALAKAAVSRGLTLGLLAEPDGRVGVDVASTFDVRAAAVLTPLYELRRARIGVRGFEALDLVTDVDPAALAPAVAAWDRFGNNGPYRHRLEVLAGPALIDFCLAQIPESPRQRETASPRPAVWRFAAICAAVNTPGSEARMLSAAIREPGWSEASIFIDAAQSRATLASLTGEPFDPPVDSLAALISRKSYEGESAAALASSMTAPLPEPITDALCAAARDGGDRAVAALGALDKAAPSAAVRRAVDQALASDEPNLQATALGVLAHHWGAEARPVWRTHLASRSAPLRQGAEVVLGIHGTAQDIPDAAAQLAKLARTKSTIQMIPPRGNEIVDLLVRHRDLPVAQAGLDDLSARWDRLGNDLREWLREHHGWLDPSRRGDAPIEQEAEAEEPLEWPPPKIEREGDMFVLWFDETDMYEARERFDELAAAHREVELIDGDRDWTSLKISGADPEGLIREIWKASHPDGPVNS